MLVRVRLLAVFDLAHKIKIVLTTTDGNGRRSGDDDGSGDGVGDDERRHHQEQQTSVRFGKGRHAVFVRGGNFCVLNY